MVGDSREGEGRRSLLDRIRGVGRPRSDDAPPGLLLRVREWRARLVQVAGSWLQAVKSLKLNELRQPARRLLVIGWPWALLVGFAALVYLLVYCLPPGTIPASLNLYLFQPALWLGLAAIGFLVWRRSVAAKPEFSRRLVFFGIQAGILQISVLALAGLLYGFGRSPYGHRPLVLLGNLFFAGSVILGMEISRACVVAGIAKRNPMLALVAATLLYTALNIPASRWGGIGQPLAFFQFAGSAFLPTAAENLLASFLSLLGGPTASIAYRGVLQAFEWLSPILPNLRWVVYAFLGTLTPIVAMMLVSRAHLPGDAETKEAGEEEKINLTSWAVIVMVAVALLWFNTGMLGIQPSVISGASMAPALVPGDLVITREVEPEAIQVGDVVRFKHEGVFVIHRVIAVGGNPGQRVFITQGDNNNVADKPLLPSMVVGKVVFVVPKIGWVSIMFRELVEWIGGFM